MRKFLHATGLAVLCGSLLVTVPAEAQEVIEIVKKGGKSSLNWAQFTVGSDSASRTFFKTLQNDLVRSGYFQHSASGPTEYQIVGRAQSMGSNLQVELRVVKAVVNQQKLGKSWNASTGKVRQLAHKVADELVESLQRVPGIASSRFVLVGNQSGKKEIYTCDSDGENLRRMTNDKSLSLSPKWGPKGQRFVYTSYLKGFPDVYMVDVASGKRDRVSSYSGLNTGASLSPDGRYLALILSKDGKPELYVKTLASGRVTRLTNTRMAAKSSPSWSPDGNRLVFVSGHSGRPHLYTISRSGGAMVRLTSRDVENVSPNWGANGLIVYSAREGRNYCVKVIDPDTKQIVMRVSPADSRDYEDPVWARDGRHIACSRTASYRSSLYILDSKGDAPIALLQGQGDWFSPSLTP